MGLTQTAVADVAAVTTSRTATTGQIVVSVKMRIAMQLLQMLVPNNVVRIFKSIKFTPSYNSKIDTFIGKQSLRHRTTKSRRFGDGPKFRSRGGRG